MFDELVAANARYAEGFALGHLAAPPARHLAVVTCMDARIDVLSAFGLAIGDAHIIRNAGGRVSDDALRSLVVSSQALGTRSVAVIQHTRCGMMTRDQQGFEELVREQTGHACDVDFLAFGDHEQALREDVARVRDCPWMPADVDVAGFVYDVETGRLDRVV